MAVTANAIRVQLPGGDIYAPAFDEAASKTGARSGLPAKHATALRQLVTAAVATLNSGKPAMIALEMVVHDDSISATLTAKKGADPTKRLLKELGELGAKKASAFEVATSGASHKISFTV